MASVVKLKNGGKLIQFCNPAGNRTTIRLGKVSMRDAEKIKTKIEELNNSKIKGTSLEVETAAWLAERPDQFYEKLVKAGLTESRASIEKKPSVKLEAFINDYVAKRTDVKPATKEIWNQGRTGLIDFFGVAKPLDEVTAGQAADYKSKMLADGLASYTISKRLQFANKIFNAAVDHELIPKNPFAKVKIKKTMADRKHFISREDTAKLLDAAPDQDWRMIIVMSRYGGLRCPSEVLSLRWTPGLDSDGKNNPSYVDFEANTICVYSPKTEHHEGKRFRIIPLFPELRNELERARAAAPEDAIYVVDPKYRKSAIGPKGWRNCNLRTRFLKIVKKAGLEPWPRIFHNLRSTRQTELTEDYPGHVVCAWLGNTEKIADKHYNQVTPEHFERAVGAARTKEFNKALQKALQSGVISDGTAYSGATPTVVISEKLDNPLYSTSKKRRGWDSPTPQFLLLRARLIPACHSAKHEWLQVFMIQDNVYC